MSKILVTGSAGFIGFHLVKALLSDGHSVVGIDNLNDYYDPQLKIDRLDVLDECYSKINGLVTYDFIKLDICDSRDLESVFEKHDFEIVFNLAAQAGVRYSLENPSAYIQSNLVGFTNILECCRNFNISHLIFASSSSVYGMNTKQPFSVSDPTDYPVSLYAATKKANELIGFSYSHLYDIPSTGLRFFTVYGPYGRPDMAYYKFFDAIKNGTPIDVYNNGNMERDFTYIDDIINGLVKVMEQPPQRVAHSKSNAKAPFKIFNIGNNNPISLLHFIETIEHCVGKKALKNMLPIQPGDVISTFADISELEQCTGFSPSTPLSEGIRSFSNWYFKKNQVKK
mgnify:CR=1 FL=1